MENSSHAVRLGWSLVTGLGAEPVGKLTQARQAGPFLSLNDFIRRTKFRTTTLTTLANVDAFRSLGLNRRDALWKALEPRESGDAV